MSWVEMGYAFALGGNLDSQIRLRAIVNVLSVAIAIAVVLYRRSH